MGATAILWPAVALTVLIYAVFFKMYADRFGYMKVQPPRPDEFATAASVQRYMEPIERSAHNHRNLFEMPVLFYVAVALLFATGLGGVIQVALGWAYVLFRAGHSWQHLYGTKVFHRFYWYLASCAVLAAMWIGFAVDLARTPA